MKRYSPDGILYESTDINPSYGPAKRHLERVFPGALVTGLGNPLWGDCAIRVTIPFGGTRLSVVHRAHQGRFDSSVGRIIVQKLRDAMANEEQK